MSDGTVERALPGCDGPRCRLCLCAGGGCVWYSGSYCCYVLEAVEQHPVAAGVTAALIVAVGWGSSVEGSCLWI